MIRKICILAALSLTLAIPASAQVYYCYGFTCEFLKNQGFEEPPASSYPSTTNWVFGSTSWWQSVPDPCAWGGGSTMAARLPAGGGVLQEFTATEFAHWSVDFDVYFGDAGGTTNDKINVYVRNLDTNAEEIFTVDATQHGLCASNASFNLSNDYSNAHVRVTLRRGTKSKMNSIDVDNVSFWGSQY